jgi:hypothetical protein
MGQYKLYMCLLVYIFPLFLTEGVLVLFERNLQKWS